METDNIRTEIEHEILKAQKGHRRGKIAGGLGIVFFGVVYLLKQLGYHIPDYLLSWQMILIVIGIVVLIKHKFSKFHGYLMIIVGKLFLWAEWYPNLINVKIIIPVAIILVGLAIVFLSNKKFGKHRRRKHRFSRENWKEIHEAQQRGFSYYKYNEDDFIDSVSFFGGITKTIVSKTFKGADIVSFFGGTDINLSQADFQGRIVIDVTNIFGGTTLTIPNNWEVISEVASIFGAFEDKRPQYQREAGEESKVIILRGTCMFGGIEVNSFNK
ncbi:LiaF domain-containing protein [Fluviicola sp.]|uniref:LiaF transmembrane domain-containing protein n=1 Tax=Fluviicola sp. TaxID=1917219 RepID=UPI0031E3D4F7